MESKAKESKSSCTIAGLYDLNEVIGKGHFATVRLARHVFTGEKVAVKVIEKNKLDSVSRQHLFQEVRCMKLVQHPHIVRLYEVIDTQSKLYLVLELGDGDMYDYIQGRDGLDVDTARIYFIQILEAIAYCHALHVVHRDLKPENVIFFEKLGIVKLTDFGFSNRFEPDTKLDTSCGSLAYSAPEILLGDSYDAPAVDVWSLGVLLYMLVTGDPPFQEANDSETLTMIMDCKYRIPPTLPSECADLISRMLRREPTERISLNRILAHPWIRMSGQSHRSECCTDSLCTALVGREHLPTEDQDNIITKMVEGGIATKSEILRALESDEYSNTTATFFLLVERRLKKQHAERNPLFNNRSSSAKAPRLMHSLSQPAWSDMEVDSERSNLPSPPHSAPYDTADGVFQPRLSSVNASGQENSKLADDELLNLPDTPSSRKFSLICEEEEQESDELNNSVISVKETKSALTNRNTTTSLASSGALTNPATPSGQDFEQSMSSMSLRRQRTASAPPTSPMRPLRTASSSPQILPLKQIHEEGEVVTSEDDVLSTHSQTSLVRMRHSSLSMASPEVARKLLSKKQPKKKMVTSNSDDTGSDNEESDKKKSKRSPRASFQLPHKRKDSSDYSSDTDGPGVSGSRSSLRASGTSSRTRMTNQAKSSSQKESPSAKKKYSEGKSASLKNPKKSDDKKKSNSTANNNCKEDNSLRVLATKLVDNSLARLSNFSLASQASTVSSRSSSKYSTNNTPRSSQRRTKDSKLCKIKLMNSLNKTFDFSELSDKDLDSDSQSLGSSIRIKLATVHPTTKDYDIIAEEQSLPHVSTGKKERTACCNIM